MLVTRKRKYFKLVCTSRERESEREIARRINSKRKFIAKSENNGKLLKNKRTLVRRVFNSNLVRCFVPNQPIRRSSSKFKMKFLKG
jgi:hypothetical protein